jgi:hypothetical protein
MLAPLLVALLAQTPTPRLGAAVDDLRVADGDVAGIRGTALELATPAGIVTVDIGAATVVDADGKRPVTTSLFLGEPVRVFYVVDGGAKAREIDVK